MADVNENFRSLIGTHFMVTKYRLPDSLLTITAKDEASIIADKISIGQQYAGAFLRLFGQLITELDFSDPLIYDDDQAIAKSIIAHCSGTLTALKLRENGHSMLSDTRHTFDRVTSLNIRSIAFLDDFQLNRIYPRLEQLTIAVHHPVTLATLGQPCAHLRRLNVIETDLKRLDDSILHGMLAANGQLRHLTVDRFLEPAMFAKLNELPDLDELALTFDERDFIHLKQMAGHSVVANVRRFTFSVQILIISPHYQIPVTFANLEELQIVSNKLTQPVQAFIARHDKLRVLGLAALEPLSLRSSVFEVIGALPALEDISLQSWHLITADDILHMFAGRQTLEYIRFVDESIHRNFRHLLAEFQQNGTFAIEANENGDFVTIRRP